MEAVKAPSIPKHTRGAAGPTGPRIDEKTPTALSPSPSTFHYCFSDQAYDHILPHPPPDLTPEIHSREASLANQITTHWEVSVIDATSSWGELSPASGKFPWRRRGAEARHGDVLHRELGKQSQAAVCLGLTRSLFQAAVLQGNCCCSCRAFLGCEHKARRAAWARALPPALPKQPCWGLAGGEG